MKRFSFLLLFLALPLIAEWQYPSSVNIMKPQEGWVRFCDFDGRFSCIREMEDGGFVATGYESPFGSSSWLMKTNPKGETLFTRSYQKLCFGVELTADGGFILVGPTDLVKTDSLGFIQWVTQPEGNYSFSSVAQVSDEGYIVAGRTETFDRDVALIKVDASGHIQWLREYGNKGYNGASCVKEEDDSVYVILGAWQLDNDTTWSGYILKTDISGKQIFFNVFNEERMSCWGSCFDITKNGNLGIIGQAREINQKYSHLYLVRMGRSGEVMWTHIYGSEYYDGGTEIDATSDDGFIITGYKGWNNPKDTAKIWVLKTNYYGDTLWTRTLGNGSGSSVQETRDGGYIVAGTSRIFAEERPCLIKLNSLGETPINISPSKVILPLANGDYFCVNPKAEFTNFGTVKSKNGFFCHCKINEINDTISLYHDSLFISDQYEPWEPNEVEFGEWVSDSGFEYTATFYATSANEDSLPSFPMSVNFQWTGIKEHPPASYPTFELLTSVGPRVLCSFSPSAKRSQASVFDALGRKVDELDIPQSGGIVSWGKEHNPGVYFIVADIDGNRQAEKVILVR